MTGKVAVVSRWTLAATAKERWRRMFDLLGYTPEYRARLDDLPERPDPGRVDALAGNTSWTTPPACDCCDCHEAEVAKFVSKRQGDLPTTRMAYYLCRECLIKALQMLEDDAP